MRARARTRIAKLAAAGTLLVAAALAPARADAFCGFYVSGGGAKLFNNATMVVLMRDGTRTVLSMQNNYQGPPESFAMVVPVPVILRKENVMTLPQDLFDKVDALTAPRLVEYWEQDPCPTTVMTEPGMRPVEAVLQSAPGSMEDRSSSPPRPPPPKIEARFSVGEYEVLILSAQDSTGLDLWLRENHYQIPPNAEPLLRPYVQMGMKFFVAKVNAAKVRFERGQAMLSPLRFHYDSDAFFLPIRLGLVNSQGKQDLIVNLLGRGTRYEVANYTNVAIPTNLEVGEEVKDRFGSFYAALFDRTVASVPRAAVTEYTWQAQSCDPCPTPPLETEALMTLGGDVLGKAKAGRDDDDDDEGDRSPSGPDLSNFTLTRIHLRYGADSLGDDLFFRTAPPISGGRGLPGDLPKGAQPGASNDFQGRYIIKHPWTGAIKCENPQRGVWGPPPGGSPPPPAPAKNLAFVARDAVNLSDAVKEPLPEGTALGPGGPTPLVRIPPTPKSGGCGSCQVPGGEGAAGGAALIALTAAAFRRLVRRRKTE